MARTRPPRKKREITSPRPDRWLATYAGLMTLLMMFFLLMYGVSQVDTKKYEVVANSISIALTGEAIDSGAGVEAGLPEVKLPEGLGARSDNQAQLKEVQELVEELIASSDKGASGTSRPSSKLSEHITIYEQERGLVISFKDTLLFTSESADLNPDARSILIQVGAILVKLPNYVRVEGHTDNEPLNTSKFASNWELSVLRATNIVQVLSEEGKIPAERLSVVGYGEHRPLVANDNRKNRSMNRRVDIVILKQKYDYFEPPSMGGEGKL